MAGGEKAHERLSRSYKHRETCPCGAGPVWGSPRGDPGSAQPLVWANKPKQRVVPDPAPARGLGIHVSDRLLKSCDKNISILHGKMLLVLLLPL